MSYSLPSISTVNGTFNITINTVISGLTAPTFNTIRSIGKMSRKAYVTATEQEIGRLALEIEDDYSVHAEGFWAKLFGSSSSFSFADIELQITLTEGVTERYYFFGNPSRGQLNWSTFYKGATRIRSAKLELVESLGKIFTVDTTDWMTEVTNNALTTNTTTLHLPLKVMSVRGLFSAMLSASNLNPTYDRDDTTFQYGVQDFKFNSPASDFTIGQLYVATELYETTVTSYYDIGAASGRLYDYYKTLQPLLGAMLNNFAVKMRIYYDLGTSRYKIVLLQQNRAYTTTLSFSTRMKIEDQGYAVQALSDAAKTRYLTDSTLFAWCSKKYTEINMVTTEPPSYVSIDMDMVTPFNIHPGSGGGAPGTYGNWLYGQATEHENLDAPPVEIDSVEYFPYDTETPILLNTAADPLRLEQALSGYAIHRNWYPAWRRFLCTYGKITASEGGGGETFSVVDILKRQSIDDEVVTKNYFANSVDIDSDKSETTVEWIQETLN